MKLCRYIGIHIIASNDIDIKQLSMELEKIMRKYLIEPHIVLETNEPYWKYPECNTIVYSILNNQNIKVGDVIKYFPISWNYSEGYAYNVNIQQRVDTEDAVWSKNCHPEETFLMPEIEWINIYTSEDEQISTIH